MTTIVRAHDVARTDHDHAADLLLPEVDAMRDLLGALTPEEWRRPTECTGWNVHDVVAHLVGNAENALDTELLARRVREGAARYAGRPRLDAMNEVAVDAWRDRPDDELLAEFDRLWPQVLQALPEMPEQARDLRFDTGYPDVPPLSLGYVVDVILTRDMWMHRVDICRATGRTFAMHPHDLGVAEQVLRDLDDEWAGPPFVLELSGLVNGDWRIGDDAPEATVEGDAMDVLRGLSGRTSPDLTVMRGDSGVADPIRAARVLF
ncbi:maleylpyruvate isomerase family mycothiol-dependent enzyme [Saccharopolyspora erythraea]|uniref:maleylpyruvate isomerase family mycothiol-dependent enzyme n=1 Tax=Saccharopolyspora erythraea TaxID=1836 RepID=UPI001BAD3632|nr:maleylpyruvate isomerase family mycothiol-dependent enzyme [Saccharopolyspora erythraea]QUH01236.1 maleylpyruvate isomerase family mycothiol-dependent enzyme [Saccharopolyspora erythraea]